MISIALKELDRLSQFSPKDESYFLEILKKNQPVLFAYPGVHYLDIGYKYIQGKPQPLLSLRVHVYHKKDLPSLDPIEILPSAIDGLPIDVIQSNPTLQKSNERNERFEPLVGGIAIRNPRFPTLGTLGCIVYDRLSSAPLGLSNYHVMVNQEGKQGDSITQPPTENESDIIGNVLRWNEQLDCALCTIRSIRKCSSAILGISHIPSSIKEPAIGMTLMKSGRTTGTTQGIIDGISLNEFTVIPIPNDPNGFPEISAPGDSGSIWLDMKTGAGVGLHYAGEQDPDPDSERAWAKKLILVFELLNIQFHP